MVGFFLQMVVLSYWAVKYKLHKKNKEFKKRVRKLVDITTIQCSEGNWNYSEYMFGMANGLIMAESVMKNDRPIFLEKENFISKQKEETE